MNIQEAKKELQELVDMTNTDSHTYVDLEIPHSTADRILCELIKEYIPDGEEIVNLFENINKWYA